MSCFYHQPLQYPGKAQNLEAFNKEEGRRLQGRKRVCGGGWGIWMEEGDGKQVASLRPAPSIYFLPFCTLNKSNQVPQPQEPGNGGLIIDNSEQMEIK